jgi:AraC family transcriptional regulator
MKYTDLIQPSIDYINQHLMEDLDLERVASQSGYSLASFYRYFSTITGFTLKEFIRNKRLAWAAHQLVTTRRRTLEIAVDCGFNSQEVFTRAFFSLYSVTPGEYRRTRKKTIETFQRMDEFSQQMEVRAKRPPFEIPVRAEIIYRDWLHLVGMEIRTSVTKNIETLSIPRFWQEVFIPRIEEIPNRVTSNTVISFEIVDPTEDSLLHLACVEVSSPEVPPGMVSRSLAAGHYAVFTPQRYLDPYEYTALVRYAYGEWFPMSGCEIRDTFTLDMNIHQAARDGKSYKMQLSVFVPIHPPTGRIVRGQANLFSISENPT